MSRSTSHSVPFAAPERGVEIVVTNAGTAPTVGDHRLDTLPAGVTFASGVGAG